jgi:PAS domain S-box-containing protein
VREDGSDFPPYDHPAVVALRTGEPVRNVIMGVYNPAEARQRWLLMNAVPQCRPGEREPTEVLTTFDDVSHLKDLEMALRRSEERFRVAAECSGSILYEWDLQTGTLRYFGERQPSGPIHVDLSADTWAPRLDPAERDDFLSAVQKSIRTGEPFEREHRLRRDDGSWTTVLTRGRIVRDASGAPARWIGASTDLTQQRESERQIRETVNLLEGVVEGSTDAIFVKNREGRYLLMNSAGASVLGLPAAEVVGKTIFQLTTTEVAARLMAHEDEVIRTGRTITFESDGPSSQGIRRYLVTKTPYRSAAGEVLGVIGIARDLTGVKLLEAELRQSQKMEAIGRLAGGIAHDFNNLLTVILGYLDDVALGAQGVDALREVRVAAERAAQLTSQLLAFSRRQVLQPEPTNLNELVSSLERMLRRIVGEDIELETTLDPQLGTVRVDRSQFDQVLLNLVVNARDAMPRGGRLTIETGNIDLAEPPSGRPALPTGPCVRLTVTDSGAGMARETLERLFEPFFTTKGRSGTGLGLPMVYGIVKQSGGDIRVFSAPGEGTTFTILLPRVEEPVPDRRERPDVAAAEEGGTETLLVVEDEPALRGMLTSALRRRGYTVHVCRDMPEALRAIGELGSSLDLVLTDVVMPHGSGVDLARQIRAHHPKVKVLLMSGYADHLALSDVGRVGSEHFIQKPFTPSVLVKKLREVLRA